MFERGFTLIELMIVVAIIAILASIGYPSYINYINRAKIIDATATLSDYRIRLEQYYQDNRKYGDSGVCGVAVPASDYFTYSCTSAANSAGVADQTFYVDANNKSGALGVANSYIYRVTEQNSKTTRSFKGIDYSSSPRTCWLIRGNEC